MRVRRGKVKVKRDLEKFNILKQKAKTVTEESVSKMEIAFPKTGSAEPSVV